MSAHTYLSPRQLCLDTWPRGRLDSRFDVTMPADALGPLGHTNGLPSPRHPHSLVPSAPVHYGLLPTAHLPADAISTWSWPCCIGLIVKGLEAPMPAGRLFLPFDFCYFSIRNCWSICLCLSCSASRTTPQLLRSRAYLGQARHTCKPLQP